MYKFIKPNIFVEELAVVSQNKTGQQILQIKWPSIRKELNRFLNIQAVTYSASHKNNGIDLYALTWEDVLTICIY